MTFHIGARLILAASLALGALIALFVCPCFWAWFVLDVAAIALLMVKLP